MKSYDQQAVKKVIDWLISIEPCEQCIFGYKFDESSKQSCNKQKLEIQEQHKDWEREIQKWQKRYKNMILVDNPYDKRNPNSKFCPMGIIDRSRCSLPCFFFDSKYCTYWMYSYNQEKAAKEWYEKTMQKHLL